MTRREKTLVVSHERSGTHLLINSIAANFGYWNGRIDLDGQGVDWFRPSALQGFLNRFHDKNVTSVFKSHHPFECFDSCIEYISSQFKVLYIYRDGRDVMASYWRFLNQLSWDEGPKVDTVGAFIRSTPSGRILRYQERDYETMLQRWVGHVGDWLKGMPAEVVRLSYEELSENTEKTVREKLAPFFGRVPAEILAPGPEAHSVLPWVGEVGNWRRYFNADDERYFVETAGPLMLQLGYDL